MIKFPCFCMLFWYNKRICHTKLLKRNVTNVGLKNQCEAILSIVVIDVMEILSENIQNLLENVLHAIKNFKFLLLKLWVVGGLENFVQENVIINFQKVKNLNKKYRKHFLEKIILIGKEGLQRAEKREIKKNIEIGEKKFLKEINILVKPAKQEILKVVEKLFIWRFTIKYHG